MNINYDYFYDIFIKICEMFLKSHLAAHMCSLYSSRKSVL